jgi:hypothetical protein
MLPPQHLLEFGSAGLCASVRAYLARLEPGFVILKRIYWTRRLSSANVVTCQQKQSKTLEG